MRTVDPGSALPRILGVPFRLGEAGSVLMSCGADGAELSSCSIQMPPGPPIRFSTFSQKFTFFITPGSTGVALMFCHSAAIAPDPASPAVNGAPERGFVPPELPAVVRAIGDGSAKTAHCSPSYVGFPDAVRVPAATPLRLS